MMAVEPEEEKEEKEKDMVVVMSGCVGGQYWAKGFVTK